VTSAEYVQKNSSKAVERRSYKRAILSGGSQPEIDNHRTCSFELSGPAHSDPSPYTFFLKIRDRAS
jgi:hypothetical protein